MGKESTSTWNRTLHPHQRTPIQTCHRFMTEVSSSSHTQILEVHSSSGSPWQVRTSGKFPHLLLDKVSILLEGNEQRHLEIYSQQHTMSQRKGQNSKLPSSDDGDSQKAVWQNCNRPSYWMWNINIWKQTHLYHYWPLNRMARGIPYTGKISRHNSFNFHEEASTSTHVS